MYSGVTFWYAEPGATSNRGAQSAAAAQTITSLDDLNRLSDLLRNGGANFIPGAIEAESLTPTLQQGVDAVAQTPDAALHPELVLSGGRQLYVPFTGSGQFVELELAQQFQAQLLRAYLTQLTNYGTVRIWVNGRLVADNVNLNASALSVVAVNLGLHAPTDNRFVIRIESLPAVAGTNYAAGVDAFVCGSVPPIVNSEWAWNLGEQDAGAVSGGATASATVEANDGYNVAYNLSKFGTTYYTNDVPSGTGSTLAISLSGAGAFTNLNCAAIANLDQNNFSIAFDAKPQKGTSTYATALCLSRYGRYSPFIYVDNKNATGAQTKWIYAVNGQAEAQITGYGPGTNKWQHVEFVRLAGTNYLYINGALAGATVTTFAGTFLPCFSVGVPVNSSTAFDTGGYFTGSLDNVVLGPPATSFSQFIAGVFPNQSDPAIIAPSSDPDHDGMANVFEFLYGTNPANASSRSVIGTASLVKIGGTNRLQYSLPMDPVSRNQLLWAVMISTDLVNWQYIADQATYSGPTNQPVVIVDPANASDFPRRFMRLVIPQ
jgi:hypothetical protein